MVEKNLGISIVPQSIAKKVDANLIKAIPLTDPQYGEGDYF